MNRAWGDSMQCAVLADNCMALITWENINSLATQEAPSSAQRATVAERDGSQSCYLIALKNIYFFFPGNRPIEFYVHMVYVLEHDGEAGLGHSGDWKKRQE